MIDIGPAHDASFLICSLLQQQQHNCYEIQHHLTMATFCPFWIFRIYRLGKNSKTTQVLLFTSDKYYPSLNILHVNALRTHHSRSTPNLEFLKTIHKETSFKTTMITLHLVQASLMHSKSHICY